MVDWLGEEQFPRYLICHVKRVWFVPSGRVSSLGLFAELEVVPRSLVIAGETGRIAEPQLLERHSFGQSIGAGCQQDCFKTQF